MRFFLSFHRFIILSRYNTDKGGDTVRSYRFLWAVIYGLVLVSFTVYACLDTFVIQRVYEIPEQPVTRFTESVTSASESAAGTETDVESEIAAVTGETSGVPETEPYVTDDSYDDGNIKITLTIPESTFIIVFKKKNVYRIPTIIPIKIDNILKIQQRLQISHCL